MTHLLIKNHKRKPVERNLVCLPSSKGRSFGEAIAPEIRKLLENYYYPDNRRLGINFS